jgi:protein SCO1/2
MKAFVSALRARAARLAVTVLVTSAAGSVALAAPAAPAAPAALPGDSVYQLPITLTGQDGRSARLDGRRGAPVLVSMFYTSCKFVCPMLIETIRDVEAKLSVEERASLAVVLVSIDPEHDTVQVLKRVADERGIDAARWTLARTDAASVRKLAAVLGIQYRALADGDFNHTTAVVLLDGDGRIAARTTRLGNADAAFVKRVRSVALAASR